MPTPSIATQAQKARALEIYRTEGPAEASRQTGFNKHTIASWARRGAVVMTMPSLRQKHATAVAAASRNERKKKLAEDLMADAQRLREQLWEPITEWRAVSGKGAPVAWEQNKPCFADQRAILAAVHSAVTTSNLLAGEATERSEVSTTPRTEEETMAEIRQLHEQLEVVDGDLEEIA